jgi:hypothetical protein
LRFLLRTHPVLFAVLLISLSAAGYFGVQFAAEALYFADPAHQQQPLALWMTPKYVGLSWGLPPDIIRDVMALEPREGRPPKLSDVLQDMNITLEELEQRIQAAKTAFEVKRLEQRP